MRNKLDAGASDLIVGFSGAFRRPFPGSPVTPGGHPRRPQQLTPQPDPPPRARENFWNFAIPHPHYTITVSLPWTRPTRRRCTYPANLWNYYILAHPLRSPSTPPRSPRHYVKRCTGKRVRGGGVVFPRGSCELISKDRWTD